MLLAIAASGCVTSGAVRQARQNHVTCLNQEIAERRDALALSDVRDRYNLYLIDCHYLAARNAHTPESASACDQLPGDIVTIEKEIAVLDRKVQDQHSTCEIIGANADQLEQKRDAQVDALTAAAVGMQVVGNAYTAAGASAPPYRPPVTCTSMSMGGGMVSTTCQ